VAQAIVEVCPSRLTRRDPPGNSFARPSCGPRCDAVELNFRGLVVDKASRGFLRQYRGSAPDCFSPFARRSVWLISRSSRYQKPKALAIGVQPLKFVLQASGKSAIIRIVSREELSAPALPLVYPQGCASPAGGEAPRFCCRW
jgi:hypothetical protein